MLILRVGFLFLSAFFFSNLKSTDAKKLFFKLSIGLLCNSEISENIVIELNKKKNSNVYIRCYPELGAKSELPSILRSLSQDKIDMLVGVIYDKLTIAQNTLSTGSSIKKISLDKLFIKRALFKSLGMFVQCLEKINTKKSMRNFLLVRKVPPSKRNNNLSNMS